jgi:hypothetical protein
MRLVPVHEVNRDRRSASIHGRAAAVDGTERRANVREVELGAVGWQAASGTASRYGDHSLRGSSSTHPRIPPEPV